MGRVTRVHTRVHTIEAVAKEIGENLELIEVISMNYDKRCTCHGVGVALLARADAIWWCSGAVKS